MPICSFDTIREDRTNGDNLVYNCRRHSICQALLCNAHITNCFVISHFHCPAKWKPASAHISFVIPCCTVKTVLDYGYFQCLDECLHIFRVWLSRHNFENNDPTPVDDDIKSISPFTQAGGGC